MPTDCHITDSNQLKKILLAYDQFSQSTMSTQCIDMSYI